MRLKLSYAHATFIADCCLKASSTDDLVEKSVLTMHGRSLLISADLAGFNGCFEKNLSLPDVESISRAFRSVAGGEKNYASDMAALMGAISAIIDAIAILNRGFSVMEKALIIQSDNTTPPPGQGQ